jgi:hypothetical protein
MLKFVACVIALSVAGIVSPLAVEASDVRKTALQAIKQDKRDKDDSAKGDDRDRLGLDKDVRNCYVYAASDRMPRPYLRYRSASDKARLEAEATLLSTAAAVYADEITQFHDLKDDSAPTFSMKAEQFRLRHSLGARGCSS